MDKNLQNYRNKLFDDVYSNRIPDRVPVDVTMYFEAGVQFAGNDLKDVCWDTQKIEQSADFICERLYSDVAPIRTIQIRKPAFYTLLRSQSFVLGASGIMQHPEVVGLLPEEYDEFILSPLDCILEKIIPRQFKALSCENGAAFATELYKSLFLKNADNAIQLAARQKILDKYGYFGGTPTNNTEAPMDFLGDQLRSFSGILADIRRRPEKVLEAVDALYPFTVLAGLGENPTPQTRAEYPLHMATYMKEKDFAKFWWPSFLDSCNTLAAHGVQLRLMAEQDWSRYIDYLQDLPRNTLFICENGDPRLFKDKLGKHNILTGFYPLVSFKTETTEKCIDMAKELIDVLAPGGGYIFQFDKDIISSDGMDLNKISAVCEYVRDNTKYANSGQTAERSFNAEDYAARAKEPVMKKSKYYHTEENYKAYSTEVTDYAASKLHKSDLDLVRTLTTFLY